MEQLLKALTRAANAVAEYYEKQAGVQTLPLTARESEALQTAMKDEPKTRKPRAAKEAAPTPPAPADLPVPRDAMTEAESEAKLKVVGEAFVQRFSKQEDAVTEVKRTIEEKFKVARLRDLKHEQRVVLIATLEARIREIDSRPTAGVGPAPTGLGL